MLQNIYEIQNNVSYADNKEKEGSDRTKEKYVKHLGV